MKLRHFTTSLLDYNSAHIQQALAMLKGELGENYILRKVFETYIYDDDNFSREGCFIAQDNMTEDVVGALTAEIVSPETSMHHFLISLNFQKSYLMSNS